MAPVEVPGINVPLLCALDCFLDFFAEDTDMFT